MATKILKRVFRHKGTDHPDPAPGLSPKECLRVLSSSFPAFTNATIEGPAYEADAEVYTVKVNAGTLG